LFIIKFIIVLFHNFCYLKIKIKLFNMKLISLICFKRLYDFSMYNQLYESPHKEMQVLYLVSDNKFVMVKRIIN